jgi:hypothetical protein
VRGWGLGARRVKSLYIYAYCLFIAAIAADLGAKGYYSRAARTIATAASDAGARASANGEKDALLHTGNCLVMAGLILAGLGLLSWVVSMAWGRRLTPLPLVLFLAYLLVNFLIVT